MKFDLQFVGLSLCLSWLIGQYGSVFGALIGQNQFNLQTSTADSSLQQNNWVKHSTCALSNDKTVKGYGI